MITANHLIYDIENIATSGGLPNEFKITHEQILYWIEEVRSMLIAQSLAKGDDINDSFVQYIDCVELEQADAAECCLAPTGCYVLKSIQQIPGTIDTWEDNNIVSVTTADGEVIPKSNPLKSRYQKYNKYTKKTRSWYLKDDYLYIVNDQQLQYVTVAGIFESPSELANFRACDGSCWTRDSKYPITLGLATQITDIILKTKVNPFMQYPQDTTNDAASTTPQQKIQNKQSEG